MSEESTTPDAPEEGNGFQPITSQEQLDKVIGGRINAVKKQFADYDTWRTKAQELEEANGSLSAEAKTLRDKVAKYEADQERSQWAQEIAKSAGVPAEALRGNTREELEAHAATIKALLVPPPTPKNRTPVPPGRSDQGDGGSRAAAALRALRAQAG